MFTEKSDSMIKKTLKSLCCSNGWCYGIFWSFDQRNSLLLTLKDAYYEEQMGALIDSLLLEVHVLGGGLIGQAAFTKNHQWMYSDAHHERQYSFEDLEVFQDDSELYGQFSMGIKTVALIPVEPWGVVQLGSTQKNLETKHFVDQVKEVFQEMDKCGEIRFSDNQTPSDSQFFNSSMQFSSLLSCGMSSEGFTEANHSFVFPSQSVASASDNLSRNSVFLTSSTLTENQIQIDSSPTDQLEQLLLDSGNFFDCSATQEFSNNSDRSVLIPSWPHLLSGLEENVSFSKEAQRQSGLLTLEELFQESGFGEAISKHGLKDDLSHLFSPQPAPFTTLLDNDFSNAMGLHPLSSVNGNNSPNLISKNLPTSSTQSSITDAFRSNSLGCKREVDWNETLIPIGTGDDLKYVGSKIPTSNSLFSKLGLDQLLDGIPSTSSCSQSSSAAKRRKIDNHSWSHEQVNTLGLPSFDGKMKFLNPIYDSDTRNIKLKNEASTKETGSCLGDSCSIGGGNTSSSKRQEEPAKTGKKKAKPGTRPRPKDRQMIQDRLAELRELIPNGEKMSIDRLLERTIRHLNFMQNLTRHAARLKQIDKPKSGVVQKANSSNGGGGVTWACEVGDQSMVCPLKVEDLSTPGQMLIEILCEEQGFFLEILDIVRGFGLIVLKGVMEARETKIWAHCIVENEGTRHVTRHEIFSSLIQLLQMTGQSAANANDSFGNIISSGVPLFNNCQPSLPFPVNFADPLQCASL